MSKPLPLSKERDHIMPKVPRCACCLGPAPHRAVDPWAGRLNGYCTACALARCDAYPGDCGRPRREAA